MNELKVLETKIDYYKSKNELDLQHAIENVNQRINKLVVAIDDLREELDKVKNGSNEFK